MGYLLQTFRTYPGSFLATPPETGRVGDNDQWLMGLIVTLSSKTLALPVSGGVARNEPG